MYENNSLPFGVDFIFASLKLSQFTSELSKSSVLFLKASNQTIALFSTSDEPTRTSQAAIPDIRFQDHGRKSEIEHHAVKEVDAWNLETLLKSTEATSKEGVWHAFSWTFQDGVCESLALKLSPTQDVAAIAVFLERIWLVMREDCMNELQNAKMTVGDDAMLWTASDQIDVAILVLDAERQIIKSNCAAKEVLESGDVLRRCGMQVVASTPSETSTLCEALRVCAGSESLETGEDILCLSRRSSGERVPVSLSRYHHMGQPTDLIVAMLPMPPNPERIELLGIKLGLTPAEARVAVLMQSGLTNREAAFRAGLKEQTFNTYAKRVLSKLHVTGRTQMAQLLTWQSVGKRSA